MSKYRRKRILEAYQYTNGIPDMDFQGYTVQEIDGVLHIKDALGTLFVKKGEYISRDSNGNIGKEHKEFFEHYYEEVKENEMMNKVNVMIKIVREGTEIPTYAHNTDAGVDLLSAINIVIPAKSTGTVIPTGIAIGLPLGYEAQVRAKSGNSLKTALRISNSVGTVDSGFIGEIGVIVDNIGDTDIVIPIGKGVAQLVLKEQPMFNFIQVDELEVTDRGEGAYGSSNRGI